MDIFQASDDPASVEIIAVHDLGETAVEAWTDGIPLAPRIISTLRNKNALERDRESSPGSHDRRAAVKMRREGPPPETTQPGARSRTGEPSTLSKEGGLTAPKQGEVEDKGKAKDIGPPKVQQPVTSEAKADTSEKDGRRIPPTPDTPRKVKAARKEKLKAMEGSARSSSEFGIRDQPKIQVVNWLRDIITTDIPRSSVLAFSYPTPREKNKAGLWMEYVESAAKDLLQRVKAHRKSFARKAGPIVFLGYGFGGIIIQKAIELAMEESNLTPPNVAEHIEKDASDEIMKQTNEQGEKQNSDEDVATKEAKQENKDRDPFLIRDVYQVLFLDTPFPQQGDSQEKELFPNNRNVRMCSILQDIKAREKESKLVEEVWSGFEAACRTKSKSFDINWMYSQAGAKQSDVDAPQLVQVCARRPRYFAASWILT